MSLSRYAAALFATGTFAADYSHELGAIFLILMATALAARMIELIIDAATIVIIEHSS